MSSKVHRVRFYNPKPHPISNISFNKKTNLIALARGDASIEIWDTNHAPFLVSFIPGVENGSVEALGWVQNRLFSTGLGGALVEWDIATLVQKNSVLLTGSAAWCLDVNSAETIVAVGTEQGYINLYSVEDNDIVYKKLFDKQEGRVMCCKFNKSGDILVTGSINSIRVWNVKTGHATSQLSVSRRSKDVFVWSVAVLSDDTIVSGDSHGRLTFWDGTLGEQIESFTTHRADVLSVAVSEDEKNIYCSGMDPRICHFVKVDKTAGKQSGSQWVRNVQRHIHEHDVRALAVCKEMLVSVGVDGYLTFSKHPPKWLMRVPPMIPTPRFSLCPQKKLLLVRYNNHLDVWKLGSYETNAGGDVTITNINARIDSEFTDRRKDLEEDSLAFVNGVDHEKRKQCLKLSTNPFKIASIQTKHKKQIQCCSMSPSGEYIVYSTDSDVRMLKLDTDDIDEDQTSVSLSKVLLDGLKPPCFRVAFTQDSRTMVVYRAGQLQFLHVDPEAGASLLHTIAMDKYLKSPAILHLVVSKKTKSGSTYVVVADTTGFITMFVQRMNKFVHYHNLPKYDCIPSAMTVDCQRERLIVVYVDQKIIEFDISRRMLNEWPGSALPSQWYSRQLAVSSVAVHPGRDALVFQDETSLWILDRKPQMKSDEPEAKRKPDGSKSLGLRIIPIKYLAGFEWIGEDEAVMLEILPENIVSQLPPPVIISRWRVRPYL